MPCCYTPTSTAKYCRECIRHVCNYPEQNIGKCPTCRQYIQIDASSGAGVDQWDVIRASRRDPCTACQQLRVIVDAERQLCEKCLLGLRFMFNYECEICHRRQRIPHPMFIYQELPNSFSSDTWFCHQLCQRQTHWRIIAADARRVPPEHAPVTWGTRDAWLAAIRQRRLAEIARGTQGEHRHAESICNMMNFWLIWLLALLWSDKFEVYGTRGTVVLLCLGAAIRAAQWHTNRSMRTRFTAMQRAPHAR